MEPPGNPGRFSRLARRFRDGKTAAFATQVDEEFRLWVAELARDVRELSERDGESRARLDRVEEDLEMRRVVGNFAIEAGREATSSRREMLRKLAAGAIFAGLTPAQTARTERAIRELDPEDLELLRAIASVTPNDGPPDTEAEANISATDLKQVREAAAAAERHEQLMSGHLEGTALLASGCVRAYYPTSWRAKPSAVVTPLGFLVLDVVRAGQGD